jgi:signal transduction histidine kinase
MKKKISNQFAVNYLIVFVLSILAALCAFILMSFAGDVLSKTLAKNSFPAASVMTNDYTEIDSDPVVQNGGGVQVIDDSYTVVYSQGLDTIGKTRLTTEEFTEFLMQSRSLGLPYHYDIAYNPQGKFWLVVTFPTSIRLGLDFAFNREYVSKDMRNVAGALVAVAIFYLLLLAIFAFIFSRITAARITNPLRKLTESARRLREGDYSARVDLKLKNEFAEIQETFNSMAGRVESEITRRKQAEEERKRLVLDISHDLKNPLSSASGYAELLLTKRDLPPDERGDYLRIIRDNSRRAAGLLTALFELSALDSPDFKLSPVRLDLCEFLRGVCAELLPSFDRAAFTCSFDIPDKPLCTMLDPAQLSRVLHNLADNAIRYNREGTLVEIRLTGGAGQAVILFADNGAGIPGELAGEIFKPFVRADNARNSRTGGTGLGLSIAQKIIALHGGTIALDTGAGKGCAFMISLPVINTNIHKKQ